jgi:hypothetical protein
MTLSELNQKLDAVVNEVTNNLGNTMVQIGNDALFTIRDRILKSGVNAEGTKYDPYSTKPMLTGCKGFKNKANCSRVFGKEKNKELKWVTLDRLNTEGKKIRLAVLEGGYKQFRELNDLQSGFVDFAFSMRMWNNIKIKSDASEHSAGLVRIGATTEEDMKKLEGNTKRRGDILKLSRNEITELTNRFGQNIQQIIDKHLK